VNRFGSRVSRLVFWQVAEKGFGMLRESQHERESLNDIKSPPFLLSTVEGLRQSFSAACKYFKPCQSFKPSENPENVLNGLNFLNVAR
jgi:hypothetical protein